jgi:hypothetical protein
MQGERVEKDEGEVRDQLPQRSREVKGQRTGSREGVETAVMLVSPGSDGLKQDPQGWL